MRTALTWRIPYCHS